MIVENGILSGYASVFNVIDAQGDNVLPGAFSADLAQWRLKGAWPKMLWQHDSRKPIGIWEDMREDAHGLFVKGRLLLDLQQGQEAYMLLKNGIVNGLSIGFVTAKAHRHGNSSVRRIEKIQLYEVSLVTFAANAKAKVQSVKGN